MSGAPQRLSAPLATASDEGLLIDIDLLPLPEQPAFPIRASSHDMAAHPAPPTSTLASGHSHEPAATVLSVAQPHHLDVDLEPDGRGRPLAANVESERMMETAGERAGTKADDPPPAYGDGDLGGQSPPASSDPGTYTYNENGPTVLYGGGGAGGVDDGENDLATATLVMRPRNPPDPAPFLAIGTHSYFQSFSLVNYWQNVERIRFSCPSPFIAALLF